MSKKMYTIYKKFKQVKNLISRKIKIQQSFIKLKFYLEFYSFTTITRLSVLNKNRKKIALQKQSNNSYQ